MRRLVLTVATVVVAVAAVLGLLLFVAGRDKSGVDSGGGGGGRRSGTLLPDQGDTVLAAGQADPRYATDPPASGAHHARPVVRDAATLSDDQVLTALAAGNVVLLYGSAAPPEGLRQAQSDVAGPFSPALARAGQAVVLARRAGTRGVVALAWRHRLTTASPTDPRIGQFADYWLGAGANGG